MSYPPLLLLRHHDLEELGVTLGLDLHAHRAVLTDIGIAVGTFPTLSLMLECAADDLRANTRAENRRGTPCYLCLNGGSGKAQTKTQIENAPRDYT